ncbi:hypothetical protein HMPREF0083_03678 [Aneurinibacillus aneurinilyticus ATCC 12856]|uniref:Uncharacterized protein n=1 Tax=Aneurinibacillus aneurinilyticus ATCC 12856 TaxID=649747 RepID=U1X102_ANEAE|nr:hypothetical protein HMPREF0083_03678 [Aneurinibacillus aneurinilyticus ATCC 12856]
MCRAVFQRRLLYLITFQKQLQAFFKINLKRNAIGYKNHFLKSTRNNISCFLYIGKTFCMFSTP